MVSGPVDADENLILSDKELSQFWYCPKDGNVLQIHQNRAVSNPYFSVSRRNIEIGINNAVAFRKISFQAVDQTNKLVNFIFEKDQTKPNVELVGAICPNCKTVF